MKYICLLAIFLAPSVHAKLTPNVSSAAKSPSIWKDAHPDWDQVTLSTVRETFKDLNMATDLSDFCPGYSSATKNQQETCLVRLVSATVYKENEKFNPAEVYDEPKGKDSVGLLMLSHGECPNALTEAELKNPIENLKCGIKRLASLVKKGKCISCRAGGGAYWSTLRPSYTFTYKNSKGKMVTLKLGKKEEIARLTKNYKDFAVDSSSIQTAALSLVKKQDAPSKKTSDLSAVVPQIVTTQASRRPIKNSGTVLSFQQKSAFGTISQ